MTQDEFYDKFPNVTDQALYLKSLWSHHNLLRVISDLYRQEENLALRTLTKYIVSIKAEKNYAMLNALLFLVDYSKLSHLLLIGLLRNTFSCKSVLKNWEPSYAAIASRLPDANHALRGLA
jgi:hypothetical protein